MYIIKVLSLVILTLFLVHISFSQEAGLCSYETNGSGKSNGLLIKVGYPCNWTVKEGERPNIVKKFSYGNKSIILLIKKLSKSFSVEEVNSLMTEEFVTDTFSDSTNKIRSVRIVTIDGLKVGELSLSNDTERPIGTLHANWLSYILFYKDYMVQLTYAVGGMNEKRIDADKEFEESLSLFKLLAMQTVVLSKWKN